MIHEPKRLSFSAESLSPYLRREPLMLAVLTGLTIVLFLAVGGLSRLYHAQQASLAERWAGRGVGDLNAGRYKVAITDFRTALLYDRDNGAYQLSLAQALLGLGRTDSTDSAYAYLINLWAREPENGVVNLELARIAVGRNETDRALRFYHNAIYATWPGNQEIERRRARLELIDYLLRNNARTQAESELIALEANAGADAAQQTQLGGLFLRVGDNARALAAFDSSLKLERKNPEAEAGAGRAELALGQYVDARRYLEEAVAAAPADTSSVNLLKITESAIEMDPFRPQISERERDQIVMSAFATAADRLKTCPASAAPAAVPGKKPAAGSPGTAWQQLAGQWAALNPQVTTKALSDNPGLVNTAMNLTFEIEHTADAQCGPGTDADQALLLVAGRHEEN
jgi:tetratricopeptide (TPR) repeat protein